MRSYFEGVGVCLAECRDLRLPFERAWQVAMTRVRSGTEIVAPDTLKFAERHFRAGYNCDCSRLGRWGGSAPEVGGTGHRVPVASEPATVLCQSGDGCDRPATCGRHGLKWCPIHGAELAAITVPDFDYSRDWKFRTGARAA